MKAMKGMTGSIKEMQSTICCSDDLTNMVFIVAGKGNYVHTFLKLILVTFNAVCRVMGLHPSWKKSHLHLIISEYNSYFAQRMRPIINGLWRYSQRVRCRVPNWHAKISFHQYLNSFNAERTQD